LKFIGEAIISVIYLQEWALLEVITPPRGPAGALPRRQFDVGSAAEPRQDLKPGFLRHMGPFVLLRFRVAAVVWWGEPVATCPIRTQART
jgi:hypothetical protein